MELQGDFSTFQRNNCKHPSSKAVRLQWRWQELRDRERRAQQHNAQLLQEFERAQETLREMMARNAAMKIIRMEYERYLDESSPCWQQPLKDKESAQEKKMEKYLKECLKRMEATQPPMEATQPPIKAQLPSSGQKNQRSSVPKEYYSQNGHLDYNLDGTAYQRIQSSWLTHTGFQSARFPDRTPTYLQGSSHVPLPPSHSSPVFQTPPVQPYQLSSASTYHHTVPLQGPPLWADTQTDCPFSWGGPGSRPPWTQPSVSERPGWGLMQQGVEERVERRTGSNPMEELRGDEGRRGDSGNHRSQELDIKPVRLSSGHGESSVTSTDSSRASRKGSRNRNKREERRGRAGHRSTDEGGSCRHAAAIASASVDQSSESDGSLEISNGRSRRSVGQSVTPSRVELKSREKNRSRSHSGSQTESLRVRTESRRQSEEPVSCEISGNQSPGDQSVSRIQESERTEKDGDTEDTVSEKSISAEQRSMAEDEGEKSKGEETGEEDSNVADEYFEESKESSQQEDQERENGEGEGFVRKSLPENGEDDEDESEGHGSEGGEEDGESVEDYSSTTQDREMEGNRCVGSEESREEEDDSSDRGGAEEEEQRSADDVGKDSQAAEPEKEMDSDSDSIISPPNHRSNRNISSIPEEAEEMIVDDNNGKESQKDSSNELSDEEDDIENLLAPQAEIQRNDEEKVQNGSDKAKVVCEDVASLSDQPISEIKDTDSDEFDHFYD